MVQGDFWNKLKKRFKEVSTAAADFTEEQALIGKLKFDILTLKRKIDRLQSNLGSLVFEMSTRSPRPNPFDSGEVRRMIGEIKDLKAYIDVKRKEITEVADRFRTKSSVADMGDLGFDQAFEAEQPMDKKAAAKGNAEKPKRVLRRKKAATAKDDAPAPAKTRGRKKTAEKKAPKPEKAKEKTGTETE